MIHKINCLASRGSECRWEMTHLYMTIRMQCGQYNDGTQEGVNISVLGRMKERFYIAAANKK